MSESQRIGERGGESFTRDRFLSGREGLERKAGDEAEGKTMLGAAYDRLPIRPNPLGFTVGNAADC